MTPLVSDTYPTERASDAIDARMKAEKKIGKKAVPTAKAKPAAKAEPAKKAPAKKQEPAAKKAKPAPKPRQAPARKKLSIPAVLLEGDLPPAPPASGPGARYALTAEAIVTQVASPGGELPEGYGTKNLFLAARDPHWLYASWDLTNDQQREYNARSRDGHLLLRVFYSNETAPAAADQHVHPESRSWFVQVPRAETRYHAELGFMDTKDRWVSISVSKSTFTPPDAPSEQRAAEFATIPPEVTLQQIVEMVQVIAVKHQPLREAALAEPPAPVSAKIETLPPAKTGALQPSKSYRVELPVRLERRDDWTQEQAQSLARLISIDAFRRVWMGSVEITELVRRQLREETSSIAAAELARGGAPSSLSRGAAPERGRAFWFKVNAELIIYGATEPDAKVTIGGRPVALRPDGSFSFRFSLPDGRYQLPAVAIARDGGEGRAAHLEFSRATDYRGQVEAHAQDPALRPPQPEAIG